MLIKLMKHDLKWILKIVAIFWGLGAALAVLSRLLFLADAPFFSITAGIASGAAVAMGLSALFNSVLRSWSRFIHCLYKDESYLIHTLPVPRRTVYESLVLSGILSTLLSMGACAGILWILSAGDGPLKMNVFVDGLGFGPGLSRSFVIGIFCSALVLEVLFMQTAGYIGIVLGHRSSSGRFARSVFWGLIVYFLAALILFAAVGILAASFPGIRALLMEGTAVPDADSVRMLLIVCTCLYGVYDLAGYFTAEKCLLSGVNVE